MITKLTLSMDKETVSQAKQLAKEQNTSVSSMISRIVRSLAASKRRQFKVGPLTQRAMSLGRAPIEKDYRELLTEALIEKYETNK